MAKKHRRVGFKKLAEICKQMHEKKGYWYRKWKKGYEASREIMLARRMNIDNLDHWAERYKKGIMHPRKL